MPTQDYTNLAEITNYTTEIKVNAENILSKTIKKLKELKIKEKEEKSRIEQMLIKEKETQERNEKHIQEMEEKIKSVKKILEKDVIDLEISRNENETLKKQIIELEENKKNLEKLFDEIKRRNEGLELQLNNEEKQRKAQDAKMGEIADKYRKVLGMDIEQDAFNRLKISFFNFDDSSDFKAHFILDFSESETGVITEMHPFVMHLDKINSILTGEKTFHSFLKKMRGIFYESVKENVE